MIYPRRFLRVSPNLHRSKVAKIICDPKQPTIDCTIIDYAPGGACLEVSGPIVLPNRFELLWAGTKKKCRVVWSKGKANRCRILRDCTNGCNDGRLNTEVALAKLEFGRVAY